MPYKIHPFNHEPPQPIKIAGILIETRIVPDLPAVLVVETQEEAQAALQSMGSDYYAVGFDAPELEDACKGPIGEAWCGGLRYG